MHAHPIKLLELLNGQVQYVVPRWQRRYCWGQSDIERLVDDLIAVSGAEHGTTHYGGTLLTFPEPGAAGVVSTIRVVDGQQRLTTISILLACIADELGHDGECEGWTRRFIFDDRLTNPGKPAKKHRKLRLQNDDEEEYRLGLEGKFEGSGAIAQAWKISQRLVVNKGVDRILKGLDRLRVVSIGLHENEDPQQIFESLNATGRPLKESEKVKNWLLLGLPDAEQQDLHENHWLRIERLLGGTNSTEPVDMFLRDWLRWRTGETVGINRVNEGIRRWARLNSKDQDRPALCREFSHLAALYGMLTGTANSPKNAKVKRELRHLREMGLDVHRPLALRLLNDADRNAGGELDDAALAEVLSLIGAWTTRMWLAGRPTAGMNKAMAELANEAGPHSGEDPVAHWLGRIDRRWSTRIGVPGDEEVREGIRSRSVFGANVRSARAILCELMEAEHREEAPRRCRLTIEHVMPQKLTEDWLRDLGDQAEEIHERYLNCLPNLTLAGDIVNPEMGARPFETKKKFYRKSSIGLTRKIAEESKWTVEALESRAEYLAQNALDRWPWRGQRPKIGGSSLKWRMEDGPWRNEQSASAMVKNVAAELLTLNSENANRLTGDAVSSKVHLASKYSPGTTVGSLTLHAIPGQPDYVIYPFERNRAQSAKRCMDMGRHCGVKIEVEIDKNYQYRDFWKLLKETTGGLPGQKPSWQGPSQTTIPLNRTRSQIAIYIGNPEMLWLLVTENGKKNMEGREIRMQNYSRSIIENMNDQKLSDDVESESRKGRSIRVLKEWTRDDEQEWTDMAVWIKDQCDRMQKIVTDRTEPKIGD